MDLAERWQDRLKQDLANLDIALLNPRRDDWDSTITQRMSDSKFAEQVNWELDALEASDLILFYFDPNTKSPITLMELGLYANSGNVIVCCPDGFWRKGNVEIVCKRSGVLLTHTYEHFVAATKLAISIAQRS